MRLHTSFAALAAVTLLAACSGDAAAPVQPQPETAPPAGYAGFTTGTPRIGYVVMNGAPVHVDYRDIGGRALYDGDIYLGPSDEIASTPEEAVARARTAEGGRYALVVDSDTKRWPNGRIPYTMSSSKSAELNAAIAQIESQVPGIDFVPRTTETTYLRIVDNSGCTGFYDGQGNSGNRVLYMSTCHGKDLAMHELGHSIGLHHEHQRCDRDTYITMYATGADFDKRCAGRYAGTSYDFSSIMHYGSNDWGYTAFRNKSGGLVPGFWGRTTISATDVAGIRNLYGLGSGGASGTTACQGGYCGPYNLRSGPGTGYGITGSVNGGVAVTIVCQTTGTTHTGPWGSTSLWNKLGGAYANQWISDAFVYTGTSGTVAPRC